MGSSVALWNAALVGGAKVGGEVEGEGGSEGPALP